MSQTLNFPGTGIINKMSRTREQFGVKLVNEWKRLGMDTHPITGKHLTIQEYFDFAQCYFDFYRHWPSRDNYTEEGKHVVQRSIANGTNELTRAFERGYFGNGKTEFLDQKYDIEWTDEEYTDVDYYKKSIDSYKKEFM